ncbi:ribosomal subunit 39S-domain-containing protein [Aspergillus karnatakaensis]|uniref:mitochondrial 54S ribosomal mL50 protein n=1 Tax=Aspergillus karnatakaensis TaxID=1810916 RepID=UPI003CCD9691
MRSSLRLLNLEVAPRQGSRTFVCSVCRHGTRASPIVARQFLRNASNDSITERVRKKLWGTDNPPGLKDPYGGEGVFEKKFKKGREGKQVVPEEEAKEVSQGEGEAPVASAAETPAAIAEETEGVDDAYEPATNWAGIERIGHLGKWTDLPATNADGYTSFSSNRRLTKPGLLYLAAHQATVEICLMYQLEKPLGRVCSVVEHDESVFELIYNCRVQPKSEGKWSSALEYPDEESKESLAYVFKQIANPPVAAPEDAATQQAGEEVEEVEEIMEEDVEEEAEPVQKTTNGPFFGHTYSPHKGYLSLSLAHPATKFAFLKRYSQLTGHHFPDPVIEAASSVGDIVDHVLEVTKPKPKKLAQELAGNKSLRSLANVKVFEKRQGPIDRDEELGRKKFIQAELRKRGLTN